MHIALTLNVKNDFVCVFFWNPFTMASEGELISRKLRNKTGSTGGSTGGADRQMSAIQDSLRTITGKLDGIGQLKQSIETIKMRMDWMRGSST